MSSEKKYSLWPALIILCLAFGAPLTIGTIETRIARNAHAETAAVQQLKAVVQAENEYHQRTGTFSATLDDLKGLSQPEPFYDYRYRQSSPQSYVASASPKEQGKHGKRYFYVDQTGVVRYDVSQPAGPSSSEVPPIGTK